MGSVHLLLSEYKLEILKNNRYQGYAESVMRWNIEEKLQILE